MYDNITFYIDYFEPSRNKIREWLQYYPKPKEGKKPLPKKYHYFKRKIYNGRPGKDKFFLTLSLRYDDTADIFRLRVSGSIRKWFIGDNNRQNLRPDDFKKSLKLLAQSLGVEEYEILLGRVTKLETGLTVLLKNNFRDIHSCFVWYRSFERREEHGTTLYFEGTNYKFVFYDKYIEMTSGKRRVNGRTVPIRIKDRVKNELYFLRFEVNVNKVSGVAFYKKNASTVGQLIENWNLILSQVIKYLKAIKFVDMLSAEKLVKEMTCSELKEYLKYKYTREIGMYEAIKLMKETYVGTNETYRMNKMIKTFMKYVEDEINRRECLLIGFENKADSLRHYNNKSNIN
ncbi:hypothetical protein ABS768_06305 [Flavobacterium sp. ST-75]|uniref:Replication initiation factor n=1 Tax=Flavobacterium rhizophilum TaxID=3163296 RepID=A0ABW8YA60_9FLAO